MKWYQRSNNNFFLYIISYSELKTRQKLRKKEEEKKQKEEQKKAKLQSEESKGEAKKKVVEVEMDPAQYTESRRKLI